MVKKSWWEAAWLSCSLVLWLSGSQDLWIFGSGSLDLWLSGSLDIWLLAIYLDLWLSGSLALWPEFHLPSHFARCVPIHVVIFLVHVGVHCSHASGLLAYLDLRLSGSLAPG